MIGLFLATAAALPLYAQRSGRTCGNCHVSPTLEDSEGWENPDLLERKCTMSCVACHVDPTGGGLRNTSGRYFGASTVAMTGGQQRSYSDHEREVLSSDASWRWLQRLGRPPTGTGRTVPSNETEALDQGIGEGQTGNAWVVGTLREQTRMAFWHGRYGSMNADPAVQTGGDVRVAYYSGTRSVFPMQVEAHAAVHPVHHLTATGTLGVRRDGEVLAPFARRLFLMTHELPGMAWARAGVFQPAYGTAIDDHTSPVRTRFEASAADTANLVTGVEVGIAPNYPVAQVAVFANDASVLGADPDTGWGATAQAGWRDLDWSLLGHAQIRRRRRLGRGNLESVGISWGYSPRWAWKNLPVTWLAEVDVGRRTVGARSTYPLAGMSELSFLLRNGVVAKLRSDVARDFGVPGTEVRNGAVLVVTPVPGFTLEGTARILKASRGAIRADGLLHTHVWW